MTTLHLPLNTGGTIPAVGLGTWQSPPGEVKRAVSVALQAGYKHIDCAYIYGNSNEVGEALTEAFAAGTVKRSDIFVTTKLWCTYHSRVEENLDKELAALGLDYVDMFLMHWPCPMNPNGNHPNIPKLEDGSRDLDKNWHFTKTWELMEKLPKSKARAIGVSNFSVPFLTTLLKSAKTVPAVNQIEKHPYLPQHEVAEFCKSKGIHVTAYSPLGSTGSPIFSEKTVKAIAEKRNVSPGCVLISYPVAKGVSVIPKSVTPTRIVENMKIVQLDQEDVAALDKIFKESGQQRFVYPSFGVDFGFPDKPGGMVYEGVEIKQQA